MPKLTSHILELAKRGAALRYAELKAELVALVKAFPHLEFGSAVSPAMPYVETSRVRPQRQKETIRRRAAGRKDQPETIDRSLEWGAAAVMDTPPRRRKRPKWSAAARKAAAQRMKRYWAARRAGRKK
jgi:hypothetical protein